MPKKSEAHHDVPTLVVDLGGTKIKVLASGELHEKKSESGPELTPQRFVTKVIELAEGWKYERVTIGFPGPVGPAGPVLEPENLGEGWVGFNFVEAFRMPVKITNDAVMQALGSYEGGRMLFLGLGTGLGGAFVAPNVILPMEIGNLRGADGEELGSLLGRAGMKKLGKKKWNKLALDTAEDLIKVFLADYVVFGGGNAKELEDLGHGMRRGHNYAAFRGGFRVWQMNGIPEQTMDHPDWQNQEWEVA
jgi:polyphosphate glucokinase